MQPLFKPFALMTPDDYAEIGLKVGIEIHQQLLTDKKLFCRCPAGLYSNQYDAEILRHMRPTLSELGEYDGTALMEFKTKKEIIYQINHKTVCTYEMDDTPPFEINQQALDISLQIAMLLNYKLVNEIHIARKQYLDGSIPTGFQRTTIVGIDGWIPYKNREIGLIQLGLEEDACREVSDIGHERVYRTDRLGMPLIEIVTRAEMYTPQEVAEVANILRKLVRSTGKVRTGIGSARQDVNVSINGGTRVEIKGVPRIPLIPYLIYNEAMRQHALLQIRENLRERGITQKSFHSASIRVTPFLINTSWDPIRQAIIHNKEIYAVKLTGYARILSYRTQTGKVFSKEISDRVRVIACLTRLPNILTSESTEETIDSFAWRKIQNALKATSQDSIVLVWGDEQDLKTAIQEIIIRAREATIGIPSETRQAFFDGTNGFERILPGPNRMYPDTDLPPLEISDTRVAELKNSLPNSLWKRLEKYKKMGIPEHLRLIIATSQNADLFENLYTKYDIPSMHIVRLLFEYTKHWKRKNLPVQLLTDSVWDSIFFYLKKQPAMLHIMTDLIKKQLLQGKMNIEQEMKTYSPPAKKIDELPAMIKELDSGIPDNFMDEKKYRLVMGKVMEQFGGHIPAEVLSKNVKKLI